jgi:hypothetical protein
VSLARPTIGSARIEIMSKVRKYKNESAPNFDGH